ncbi:F-box domain-containing protein [Favolaschia claudopus]|uniref:F-box domain-containing protein n=1 Tax=Favolaschia claudopus TaxID=2862362 RepID=A0AAW0D6L5_9AGAR
MGSCYLEAFFEHIARISGSSSAQMKLKIGESQSKIASLECQIASLIAKCEQERVYLAALQYSIAPIRSLPVELLAEIFSWTVFEPNTWSPVYERGHFQQTLYISHVCSHWRKVAQTTPRLWTGPVEISNRRPTKMSIPVYAQELQKWLERSAPLSIPISFATDSESTATWEDVRPVLEEALKISVRWHSCDMYFDSFREVLLQDLSEYPMDTLETLFIEGDDDSPGPVIPVTLAFGATPRLRRLNMGTGVNVEISWTQLTRLDLRPESPKDALDILSYCPNLVDVTIVAVAWRQVPEARLDIVLNRLRELHLTFFESPLFMPFLQCLFAPRLKHLTLHLNDEIVWDAALFRTFQLRSPNIRRLKLAHSDITSAQLRDVLVDAPLLKELSLSHCECIDTALFRALRYEDGVLPLVPYLHDLQVTFYTNEERDTLKDDMLADMMSSRWWTDAQLETISVPPVVSRWTYLYLGPMRDFSQRLMNTIEELRSQGLTVQVGYD